MADTIILPLGPMALISGYQLPNTAVNLLQWIKANNIYSQTTGGDLKVVQGRGLDTAGAAGQTRSIGYTRDPQNLKLHRPMPHNFMDPMRTAPLTYSVPGIFRLAGLEIRYPGACRYLDGL